MQYQKGGPVFMREDGLLGSDDQGAMLYVVKSQDPQERADALRNLQRKFPECTDTPEGAGPFLDLVAAGFAKYENDRVGCGPNYKPDHRDAVTKAAGQIGNPVTLG